ncbi:MAG: polymer-forming cytoskeletal protein [Chitinispirillia bacterium]|nr:polymer-forming cytoskeletal protein [Chitinispirillia bacterium]
MFKKSLFLTGILLLSSLTFAQNQTFTLRPGITPFVRATASNGGLDRNYTNPNFYESERFIIRYWEDRAHDAFVSAETAENRLRSLETAYDSIVTAWNFYPPFHVNRSNPATYGTPVVNTLYKSEVIVTRGRNNTSGTTLWADGGGAAYGGLVGAWNNGGATSTERPLQWIGAGLSATTLTHELVHGLQQMSSGMRDSDFVGWFHECHAQFLTSLVHGGTSGGLTASRVTKRQAHLHTGYARSRYENWPWLEYILHFEQTGTHSAAAGRRDRLRSNRQDGMDFINRIWTHSPGRSDNARRTADPFTEAARVNNMTWSDFGDVMGHYAMRSVTFDYGPRRATFRTNYNAASVNDQERHQRYTYLQALDTNDLAASNNRYVSPHAYAPQRLGFNIIRLYPEGGGNWTANSTVTVQFRGDVQTANNRTNYVRLTPNNQDNTPGRLEPAAEHVHNNPGSAWRYGLVAVTGDAASTANTVTARYSDLMRTDTSGANRGRGPNVSITMQSGETQLYLVVTAAPTQPHKLRWDQYHYTTYRFPYMVQIDGAKPQGFQTESPSGTNTWRTHTNGGGQVASNVTVPATVFVGPHARVFGGTLAGNARIEGRAVVRGGTVRGDAVVRDHAVVRSGTVEGNAIVSDGATIWGATVNQNARVHGSALLTGGTVTGTAQVGGAAVISGGTISGTAQALGDAFGSLTQSSGVWYAAGSGASGDTQGASRTAVPVEFTKALSRTWYGEDQTSVTDMTPVIARNTNNTFHLDNRGTLRYNLAGAPSATLRIFDSRGRVIKTMTLSGSQNMVSTNINAASQMLLWKVDVNGKIIGQGRVNVKN